jgi:hypothetical protein
MEFFRKHKLIAATVAIQIVVLPLMLLMVKQEQETSVQAAPATTLYFNPASSVNAPIIKNVNDAFALDLMVAPGNNLVSLIKVEINYDPAKFKLSATNPIIVNSRAFPVTVEGPVISESAGKIQIVVSVGSDQTKVIQEATKILSLNMVTINSTNQTQISVNTKESKLLTVSPHNENSENVLSYSYPAYVTVNAGVMTK